MANRKKIDDELNLASEARKTATDNLNNMSYDNFKQGSMYQGIQKDYAQQGQQAMKDTLGQVAARTGGMASSYATQAANQSYNNYMRQLEDVARAMYNDEYSKARDKVSLAQGEYDRLYGESRDAIADQRYNESKEEERIANDAYYGNTLSYGKYKANGGTLSEQAYNSIVSAARYKRAIAEPKPEFKGVSGTDFDIYYSQFSDIQPGDEKGAEALADAIGYATGSEDLAFALYEMWLSQNGNR